MSRIAIVAAMHEELSALLEAMPDEAPVRRAGREFWVGHLEGHEVVAVLSRVGKVAAATTATLLVSEFDVDRAIFTGTAGGLHECARVGDVVVAEALLQHDMDASPLFPRYEVPLYGTDRFCTDPHLSQALAQAVRAVLDDVARLAASEAAARTGTEPGLGLDAHLLRSFGIASPGVHTGLVVSGDRFVATAAEGADLRRRLPDALAVEMEGAALAQVCHDLDIPFAVVRTVSDRADDSAHVDFGRFVASIASRYTLAIIRRFLRRRDH
jgi:adenosylhomocysteine nucleosidase